MVKCSNSESIVATGYCPCKNTVIAAACTGHVISTKKMPTAVGFIDGKEVSPQREWMQLCN